MVNWVLTQAQIDLIAADVSVVDYDYGKMDKKKRKRGEFDNTPADKEAVRKAGAEWLKRNPDGAKKIDAATIFGGLQVAAGVKL